METSTPATRPPPASTAVPLIVTVGGIALRGPGILADVAPTVLALLGIAQPPEMTGEALLAR